MTLSELELQLEEGAILIERQRLLIMRQSLAGQSQMEAQALLEVLLETQKKREEQYQHLLRQQEE
jgi:hypothetical protein